MAFSKLIKIPEIQAHIDHVYNNYSFRIPNRDKFILQMKELGIDCRVYYPISFDEDCKNAVQISKEIVSIPIRPNMLTEEVNHITESILEYLENEKVN